MQEMLTGIDGETFLGVPSLEPSATPGLRRDWSRGDEKGNDSQ